MKTIDVLGVGDVVEGCKGNDPRACAKASLDLAAAFDPTGMATIAAAFLKPDCDSIKHAEPVSTRDVKPMDVNEMANF